MNILIIHTAFIGDIVLSTALIAKLKDKYPDSNIYFLTTPVGVEVLKNNPKIKEIISYDKRKKDKGIFNFLKLAKDLKKRKIDICVCPHRYIRSSLLALLSGAEIKIAYDIASLSFIFDKKIKYDKSKHEVEKLLSFVDNENKRYELEMYPDKVNMNRIENLLKEKNKKIICLAPGSKWFTKKWPEEYFRKLITSLSTRDDILLVISGGKEELEISLDLPKNVIDLRGKISLLDLAELSRRSTILISNDSAPIHIASAFSETYIIGIFGPTIREFGFFPWSKNSKVFEVKDLYCRPCGIHGGKICPEKHFRCMKEIQPKIIEEEVIKYLESSEKKEFRK